MPTHLLYSHQLDVLAEYHTSPQMEFVFVCGRRFGKTATAVWEALSHGLLHPGSNILYVAPTAKQLRRIVRPHFTRYLADCPVHLRPVPHWQDGEIRFANGSIIYLSGTENQNAESLRGIETHLAIVDEPASMAELDYLVEDIITPQTLTTDGRIIMPGTPPKQPAHPFSQVYVARARLGEDALLCHRTVNDAKHLKPETIARLRRKAGGEDSVTWRREYLAEDVYDSESSIVPEFSRFEEKIVEERPRPLYCRKYVFGDIGFVDLSFWLFGFVDFDNATIVIEDELVFSHKATSDQVAPLMAREKALWGEGAKPVRLCDAEPLVLAEFTRANRDFAVGPVDNSDLDASINRLRLATQRLQYRIHPRCRHLIAHMKMGTWNKRRTGFERVEGYGHFDGIAALMYAVKHADTRANPYPDIPEGATREDWKLPPKQSTGSDGWGALKRRRSGR
jgi:hypothetical protein